MTAHEHTQSDPAEDAVRRYLLHLSDPSALIDTGMIEQLQGRLADETDVIARLKIVAAIESFEHVDEVALRKDFVRHARSYAERENIPLSAYAAIGVPRDVLGDAGLLGGQRNRKAQGQRPPRTRVGRDTILAAVPAGYFTVRDLEQLTGANSITVRKVVDDLIATGTLTEHGPDPDYQGRGRAPRRYRKV